MTTINGMTPQQLADRIEASYLASAMRQGPPDSEAEAEAMAQNVLEAFVVQLVEDLRDAE